MQKINVFQSLVRFSLLTALIVGFLMIAGTNKVEGTATVRMPVTTISVENFGTTMKDGATTYIQMDPYVIVVIDDQKLSTAVLEIQQETWGG